MMSLVKDDWSATEIRIIRIRVRFFTGPILTTEVCIKVVNVR